MVDSGYVKQNMTKCVGANCGKFQNRLNKGKLCDTCYQVKNNKSSIDNENRSSDYNSQAANNMMNSYMPSSILSSQINNNIPGLNNNLSSHQNIWQHSTSASVNLTSGPPQGHSSPSFMNPNNTFQSQQRFGPSQAQFNPVINPTATMNAQATSNQPDTSDPMIYQLMNKPSGDLSAGDIFKIVQLANKEIHTKIDDLSKHFSTEIASLKNNIQILQSEKQKKDEEIQTLKYTITGMQKSINMIDSKERDMNVVIYGLPEEEIDTSGGILANDKEKIQHILQLVECRIFDGDAFSTLEFERIGRPRENYNRVMKVKCGTRENRDEFIKNSNKLKEAEEMWKKVYIRKDEHPVYIAEKKRLRKKMFDLKKIEENESKEIVIKDGKLLMDGVVVDKNTFFA